jgi:hypothetical protein
MARLAALMVMTGLVMGCGSGSDDEGSGECAQRVGTYRSQFTQRSGNCGPIPESTATFTEQPTSVDPQCLGWIRYTPDNCGETSERNCPTDDGGSVRLEGAIDWNRAGSRGEGTEERQLYDASGSSVCLSTYDVVVTRQ